MISKLRYKVPFPCLEVICLCGCNVTHKGINSFIHVSPTLQNIVVGNKKLNPANDYSTIILLQMIILQKLSKF